jgi:hypothetical protein
VGSHRGSHDSCGANAKCVFVASAGSDLEPVANPKQVRGSVFQHGASPLLRPKEAVDSAAPTTGAYALTLAMCAAVSQHLVDQD